VLVVGTGVRDRSNYAIAWRERNATAELELNGFKLTLPEALALARQAGKLGYGMRPVRGGQTALWHRPLRAAAVAGNRPPARIRRPRLE